MNTASSFGVQAGKSYRFMVRAINYCIVANNQTACLGAFSDTSVFAARAPRLPLPPPMPYRSSLSNMTQQVRIVNVSQTRWSGLPPPHLNSRCYPLVTLSLPLQITVRWLAPTDNGGSPIVKYTVYVAGPGSNTYTPTDVPVPTSPATALSSATYDEVLQFTATNVVIGSVYRVYVTATNAIGASAASPVLAVAAGNPPGMTVYEVPAYRYKYRHRDTLHQLSFASLFSRVNSSSSPLAC